MINPTKMTVDMDNTKPTCAALNIHIHSQYDRLIRNSYDRMKNTPLRWLAAEILEVNLRAESKELKIGMRKNDIDIYQVKDGSLLAQIESYEYGINQDTSNVVLEHIQTL